MDVTRLTQWGRGLQDRLRTIFDGPLAADATPLEIVQAVLDDVEGHVEPVGRGRRVFPYASIDVRLLVTAEDEAGAAAVLDTLDTRVRERLAEVRCEPGAPLQVTWQTVTDVPTGWTDTQRFDVTYRRGEPRDAVATTTTDEAGPMSSLVLEAVRGTLVEGPRAFRGGTVSIGRSTDPTDAGGRVRRNRVTFADEADGVNETVGRAHARVRHVPETGEYRLYDEGSRNGTSVVRDGEVIAVPRYDPRGVRLRDGDEIHVGRAILRVAIGVD